jgi:Ni,Fe-hydrogenase III small subunit
MLYDLSASLRFVASPRHADVLMVTGPVTKTCAGAGATHNAARPEMVVVSAIARATAVSSESYAVVGGVAAVVPVDLHIRGCPPRPEQLLKGLLALLNPGAVA